MDWASDMQYRAGKIARFSGLFFVVIGGVFSVLNAGAFVSPATQFASTASSTQENPEATQDSATSTTDESATDEESEPTVDTSQYADAVVYVTPNEPMQGVVELSVTLPDVYRVDYYMFRDTYRNSFKLGSATESEPGVWTYDWNSSLYRDGSDYRFEARYWLEATQDTHTGAVTSDYYPLDNALIDTDSVNSQESEETYTAPQVTITLTEQPEGIVQITTSPVEAEEVLIRAVDENQGLNDLGDASQMSDGSWVLDWDTTQYATKRYTVWAKVTNSQETFSSESATYTIQANDANSNDTSSATLNVTKQNQTNALVKVDVADATKVTVLAAKTNESDETVGEATKIGSNSWSLSWNTSQYSPGSYTVWAEVETDTGLVTSSQDSYTIEDQTNSNEDQSDKSDTPLISDFEKSLSDGADGVQDEVTSAEIGDDDSNDTPTNTDEITISEITIEADSILSGEEILTANVKGATYVNFYLQDVSSTWPRFIGTATKTQTEKWILRYNTINSPNGNYELSARAGVVGTAKFSNTLDVVIDNQTLEQPVAPSEVEEVRNLIPEEVSEPATTQNNDREQTTSGPAQTEVADSVQKESTAEALDDVDVAELVTSFIEMQRSDIQTELAQLTRQLRSNSDIVIESWEERIARKVLQSVKGEYSRATVREMDNLISERVRTIIEEHIASFKRTDELIERRSVDALTDSDNDGITDFDELELYGTDPMSADTDGDGFIDGVEIIGGYDPLNPVRETVVEYQSPKEAGVERSDVLAVDAVEPIEPAVQEPVTPDPAKLRAEITGRAMPNSFVTLYIYSTPIVVTVKTDADGSWRYTFDKELEDGEHEVYVGVTDNAGRVVAKSAPYRFIKEAQAITPVAQAAQNAPVSPQPSSLTSQSTMLLVGSVSLVAIGLVLILIGLSVEARRRELELANNTAAV